MPSLKNLYNVDSNIRGVAKQGYCRPTIAEMWITDEDYEYPWCSLQPVTNNGLEALTDNDLNAITVEA